MTDKIGPNAINLSDHERFRQSVAEFERTLVNQWRTTIVEIGIVLAVLTLPLLRRGMFTSRSEMRLINCCLLLILMIRGYELMKRRQIKSVLAEQMKISARQHRRADKLYGLSILDPLTALHNRRFGEERLREEIARAEKGGDALAVLLLDLDYFKEINDKYGHAVGDLALKEFSRRLRRAIRSCDVPVRMGGDEFLVILPECPRDKVDTILSRIGSPHIEVAGQKISVQYTTGRAHYQYSDTLEVLLGRADEILYTEKAARSRREDGQNPAIESMRHAESSKISYRHALKLDEVNWGRY